MPPPMVPQLDFIQKLTPLLGFKNISLPNTEADDLMGCYAMAACKRKGMEVVLATNDKDLYQLIGPCVKVYTTAKADLVSPKDGFALLGEEQATAKWDVPPKLIGDVLAIAGDLIASALGDPARGHDGTLVEQVAKRTMAPHAAARALFLHAWPLNVRELERTLALAIEEDPFA